MKLVHFLAHLLASVSQDASPRVWARADPRKRKHGKSRVGSKPPAASSDLLRARRKRERQARKVQRRRAA